MRKILFNLLLVVLMGLTITSCSNDNNSSVSLGEESTCIVYEKESGISISTGMSKKEIDAIYPPTKTVFHDMASYDNENVTVFYNNDNIAYSIFIKGANWSFGDLVPTVTSKSDLIEALGEPYTARDDSSLREDLTYFFSPQGERYDKNQDIDDSSMKQADMFSFSIDINTGLIEEIIISKPALR